LADAAATHTAIRAVLFDFYDTLARIEGRVALSRQHIAEVCGIEYDRFQGQWRETLADRTIGRLGPLEDELAGMLCSLGATCDPDVLRELAEGERAAWVEGVRLYTDTIPTLEALQARGFATGLVSNCTSQTVGVLAHHELDRYLDTVVLSCEVGIAKPDPGIFLTAVARLNLEARQCAFVADGAGGELDVARELGMYAVLVEHDDQHRASVRSNGHDARIERLADLLEFDRLRPPPSQP
jgi:putative hydrolase of the HAD superfamily